MPGIPGGWELVLLLGVLVLLFGASKLPNAARSIGQSMRIFKAETKGMRSDDGQTKDKDHDKDKDHGTNEAGTAAPQDRGQEALPPSAPSPDPSRPAEQPHRTDTAR